MTVYQTNNSRLNSDKLGLIFILAFATLAYLYKSKFDLLVTFTLIFIEAAIAFALIYWYRTSAFVVNFNDTNIEQVFTYSKSICYFSYNDLKELRYIEGFRGPTINTIKIQKDGSIHTLKVNVVERGEKYVLFIKWLKTKKPDFETYIYPKGSELHMRLRQELLKTEY